MPVCPQCDNRVFSNKEALLQHMKSSSAWHPLCSVCDRRFVSQDAFDAHMKAKHPPTFDCLTCSKSFHAPFALEDHYRGSASHPNCIRCGRGFKDDAAREEHLRTAHPKVPCAPCGGHLVYEDVLDQHYTESPNHPTCSSCLKGVKDDEAYSTHITSSHPEIYCSVCRTNFLTPQAKMDHLWNNSSHPKCELCLLGFEDDASKETHMEMHAQSSTPTGVATQSTAALSPILPMSRELGSSASFEALRDHDIPLYSTGFTPLSPKNHAQRLIVGQKRVDSPDLKLQMNFSSPIQDVRPVFSPTSLPRPGEKIEELWSSRENVEVPSLKQLERPPLPPPFVPASRAQVWSTSPPSSSHGTQQSHSLRASRSPPRPSSSRSSFFSDYALQGRHSPPAFSPPRHAYPDQPRTVHSHSYPSTSSASSLGDTGYLPHRTRHMSPPKASPPRTMDFNPRLYPGSVRASLAGLQTRPSPPAESSFARPSYFASSDYGSSTGGSGIRGRPLSFTAGMSTSSNSMFPHSSLGRARGSFTSEQGKWRERVEPLATPDPTSIDILRAFSPELENISTPRSEVPIHIHARSESEASFHGPSGSGSLQVHNLPTSPSLATVSSPASSALGNSPGSTRNEPETRPTTAASNRTTAMHQIEYTITMSSDCGSPRLPRSPEVSSPAGLAVLPAISPLPATPIDIALFDIPEAYRPLPESPPPETLSPVTIVLEENLSSVEPVSLEDAKPVEIEVCQSEEATVPPTAPSPRLSPASSSQSYITSPLAPLDLEEPVLATPNSSVIASSALEVALEVESKATQTTASDNEMGSSPDSPLSTPTATANVPTAVEATASVQEPIPEPDALVEVVAPTPPTPTTNLNPLHCRVCLADSCDDITASMCGHIFCNRCITDAVIKTNRCPVCMTPTLLYCLFRLDLGA